MSFFIVVPIIDNGQFFKSRHKVILFSRPLQMFLNDLFSNSTSTDKIDGGGPTKANLSPLKWRKYYKFGTADPVQ